MFIFLGVKYGSGVPGVVDFGITSFVALGVTGLVTL